MAHLEVMKYGPWNGSVPKSQEEGIKNVYLDHFFPVFGLPKQASTRLLTCLVPIEPLDGAVVRYFILAVLSNSFRFDINAVVIPALRWTNCKSDFLTTNNIEILSCFLSLFILPFLSFSVFLSLLSFLIPLIRLDNYQRTKSTLFNKTARIKH